MVRDGRRGEEKFSCKCCVQVQYARDDAKKDQERAARARKIKAMRESHKAEEEKRAAEVLDSMTTQPGDDDNKSNKR